MDTKKKNKKKEAEAKATSCFFNMFNIIIHSVESIQLQWLASHSKDIKYSWCIQTAKMLRRGRDRKGDWVDRRIDSKNDNIVESYRIRVYVNVGTYYFCILSLFLMKIFSTRQQPASIRCLWIQTIPCKHNLYYSSKAVCYVRISLSLWVCMSQNVL